MKQMTKKFMWFFAAVMMFVMMTTVTVSAETTMEKYNRLHSEACEYLYTSSSYISSKIPKNCITKTNPTKTFKFTLKSPRVVTSIWLYHKNLPSNFNIKKQYVKITNTKTGKVVYKGTPVSGSKSNWFLFPNKKLAAGTYSVTCSSKKTWAYGTGTKGKGLMDIHFVCQKHHKHSYGAWKVVKKATTTATGKKQRTCKVCGKVSSATIPKVVRKYAWVLTDESSVMKPAPKYYTFNSEKKTGAEYRYYDTISCRSTNLTYNGVVPSSTVVSNFAYPPKQVSAGKKLDVKLHVSTVRWNDNENYYAQGGTDSGAQLVNKKMTLDELNRYNSDYVYMTEHRVRQFENYDCSTGDMRWYGLGYTNACFGQSWTDTFFAEMPEGKKAGEKVYLMMYSTAAVHWYTYTWTAIN